MELVSIMGDLLKRRKKSLRLFHPPFPFHRYAISRRDLVDERCTAAMIEERSGGTSHAVAIARSRWTTPQVWFRCGCSPEAVTVNRYTPLRNIQFRMESDLTRRILEYDTSFENLDSRKTSLGKDYLFVRFLDNL